MYYLIKSEGRGVIVKNEVMEGENIYVTKV